MEQLGSPGRILIEFNISGLFEKSVEKIQTSLKSVKNKGYFIMKSNIRF